MPTPLTIAFSIELDDYRKRDQEIHDRVSSGRTSIRVSKSTLEQLRKLCATVADVGKGDKELSWWSRSARPSPDALLAAIARGHVRAGHASAGSAAPAKKKARKKTPGRRHASKRSTKGMRRRPTSKTRKGHASSRARKGRR